MMTALASHARMRSLSGFESRLIRAAGTVFSRRGRFGALLVLIYHRVLPAPDPLLPDEPDAAIFEAQLELITRNFNVLPLREAARRLKDGTLPRRAVCITFDDGYSNNHDIALPILKSRQVPATVFVAPGFLNGGRMFNDTVIETLRRAPPPELDLSAEGLTAFDVSTAAARCAAIDQIIGALKYLQPEERLRRAEAIAARADVELPKNLMMTDGQVMQLHRSGIEIGAHTVSHPILARLDPQTAWREVLQSKHDLEEITGGAVRSFAYPNGRPMRDYQRIHVEQAKAAGFDLAVSTAWGAATALSDMHQLPRIAPWDKSARRYALRMVSSYRRRRYETV